MTAIIALTDSRWLGVSTSTRTASPRAAEMSSMRLSFRGSDGFVFDPRRHPSAVVSNQAK